MDLQDSTSASDCASVRESKSARARSVSDGSGIGKTGKIEGPGWSDGVPSVVSVREEGKTAPSAVESGSVVVQL